MCRSARQAVSAPDDFQNPLLRLVRQLFPSLARRWRELWKRQCSHGRCLRFWRLLPNGQHCACSKADRDSPLFVGLLSTTVGNRLVNSWGVLIRDLESIGSRFWGSLGTIGVPYGTCLNSLETEILGPRPESPQACASARARNDVNPCLTHPHPLPLSPKAIGETQNDEHFQQATNPVRKAVHNPVQQVQETCCTGESKKCKTPVFPGFAKHCITVQVVRLPD